MITARKALAAGAAATVLTFAPATMAGATVPDDDDVAEAVGVDDDDDDSDKTGLWGLLGLLGLAGLAGLRRRPEHHIGTTTRVQADTTPRGSTSTGH